MRTKIVAIISVAMLSVASLQAQVNFGVVAGPNFQNMTGKDADGDKVTNGLIVRFHAGVQAAIPISPDFSFQTGLLFSQKGSKNNEGLIPLKSSSDEYHTTTCISYVELPLHLLFRPEFGSGRILIGFGPYVAYGIAGKQKVEMGSLSYEQKIKFKGEIDQATSWDMDHAYYRGFDAGADIYAGYEMAMGFFVRLNAQLGLLNMITDIQDWDYEPTLRNTGFSISAGYNF